MFRIYVLTFIVALGACKKKNDDKSESGPVAPGAVEDLTPPGAFVITAQGQISASSTITVAWDAASNAATYDLTISRSADCSAPIQTFSGLTVTSQAVTLPGNGTYYACVNAKTALGGSLVAANNGVSLRVSANFALGQADFASVQGLKYGLKSPGSIASDGTRLVVADEDNLRVLIYNSLPTANQTIPSVVLGQPNSSEVTNTNFSYPSPKATNFSEVSGVAFDGTRLFVVDREFNRVLIWNSLPTTNNQAADIVIGQTNFTSDSSGTSSSTLKYPQAVYSDGTNLFVADTGNNRVLVWTTMPTTNGQAANRVLGQSTFGTGTAATTATGMDDPRGVFSDGTHVYVSEWGNSRVLMWNTFPASNGQTADYVLGQTNFTSDSTGTTAARMANPVGVFAEGSRVYVADYWNNRVLVWNNIPSSNGVAADVVIGQSTASSSTSGTSATTFKNPSGVYSNGSIVYVADRSNNRIQEFTGVPSTNGASANRSLGQPNQTSSISGSALGGVSLSTLNAPASACGNGTSLLVADSSSDRVLLWNTLPGATAQAADIVLGQADGTAMVRNQSPSASNFDSPQSACPVGSGLAAVDSGMNRILLWNSMPTSNAQAADLVLGATDFTSYGSGPVSGSTFSQPKSVFSNGTKLLVVDQLRHRVLIWNSLPTTNGQAADVVVGQSTMSGTASATTQTGLEYPSHAIIVGTKLVVADRSNNRVLIWNQVPTTNGAPADLVLGQTVFTDYTGTTSDSKMADPSGVYSDGTKFYVADTGSNRILVWNSFPTTNGQAADEVIGQASFNARLVNGGLLGISTFNSPTSISGDATNLYITDSGNDRIVVYPLVQ